MAALRQQRADVAAFQENGEDRLGRWEAAVKRVLRRVKGWLKPLTDEGLLTLGSAFKVVSDDKALGDYNVPVLVVRSPNGTRVKFEPMRRCTPTIPCSRGMFAITRKNVRTKDGAKIDYETPLYLQDDGSLRHEGAKTGREHFYEILFDVLDLDGPFETKPE